MSSPTAQGDPPPSEADANSTEAGDQQPNESLTGAAAALRLARLIDASPTPAHAVSVAISELAAAGARAARSVADAARPGLWYRARRGTLTAWRVTEGHTGATGVRIVGAHTDSPNLRIKPRPDIESSGCRQVGVEVYGGALLNSWLDRDLGVAGELVVRDGDAAAGIRRVPVRIDEPLLRVPQLAIHLDRGVNTDGLVLNPQQHLNAVWALADSTEAGFVEVAAAAAQHHAADVLAHDLMAFDVNPARLWGPSGEFLSSARIDNLLSCFAAIDALITAPVGAPRVSMVCLFDHEEVGSVSAVGAASPWLGDTIDMITAGFDAGADDVAASRADSMMLSADGAHATHPNYPQRHDPGHEVRLNGGPVLKWNSNQRYATDTVTAASFRLACERAEAPVQQFVSRSDMACGSTIGPITAGRLGIAVVDAGCAQWAMHSARETCGSLDVGYLTAAMRQFLTG